MKENKKKIVEALITKHIETIKTAKKHIEIIKTAKLSNINGGEGCDVIIGGSQR